MRLGSRGLVAQLDVDDCSRFCNAAVETPARDRRCAGDARQGRQVLFVAGRATSDKDEPRTPRSCGLEVKRAPGTVCARCRRKCSVGSDDVVVIVRRMHEDRLLRSPRPSATNGVRADRRGLPRPRAPMDHAARRSRAASGGPQLSAQAGGRRASAHARSRRVAPGSRAQIAASSV